MESSEDSQKGLVKLAVTFTKDQQRVIDTRERNILVSAAAGSGKTAVLVERIIQKICDTAKKVDIDRLLIVTFTSAAAAQMRERISDAIMKKLDEEPENEHLQKQAALIHNAQITTIDSFCLFIIRNNFNAIGLDPGFRVADEGELKLTKKDVLDKLLEDEFTKAEKAFLQFVECYSTGAGEKNIEEAILRLYEFSMSYPFPEEWLLQRKTDYLLEDIEELPQKDWYQKFLAYYEQVLLECKYSLKRAMELAKDPYGPDQYIENLVDDESILDKLLQAKDYGKLYQVLGAITFSPLSRKKGTDVDPEIKERVKVIRDGIKENINGLKKQFFQTSPELILTDMKACQEIVEELVDLTIAFKTRLDETKREKNIIDFSDMEHFALQILLHRAQDGTLELSDTAKEMQDYFEEIMIDEYQDSNDVQELLLKSISGESKGHFNRFMVGDVKQSIYKFRLARPEIFMDKYEEYETDETAKTKMRIDLSKNFRSRVEVTDATNYICGQIMQKAVGNVEYDEKAVLNLGATYYPAPQKELDFQTQILIATPNTEVEDSQEEGNMSAKELEAHMVAQKILELKENFLVTDSETGTLRPTRFGDIVLLFRATSGWDEDFRKVLSTYNIPVHISSKTGYFQTMEIQGIVNMLKVLDNPLQDLAFYGFLRLPFLDFSEEQIAQSKVLYEMLVEVPEGEKRVSPSLYEQMTYVYEHGEAMEQSVFAAEEMTLLLQKIQNMINLLEKYRDCITYTPIKELIQQILVETGYAAYVASMPGGEQRQANMELLLEKAGAFEKTSFYGLFHFIRYLETIKEQDVDFGEANILDENADVVRIMTIHKSKGLEFPICFVCGLSKQFNLMDTRKSIVMDVEAGIGVDYIDPKLRIKRKTFRKNMVAKAMLEDTRGEDLRVFYVAMTRAKEKLFMTGYCEDFMQYMKEHAYILSHQEQKLGYMDIMKAKSYFDLVIPACLRHTCMAKYLREAQLLLDTSFHLPYQEIPMQLTLWQYQSNLEKELLEQGEAALFEDALMHAEVFKNAELEQRIAEKLLAAYAHENLKGLTVKTTVSDLKKAAYQEKEETVGELFPEEKEPYIPRFLREEEEMRGTQYGTAVHKVMELLSYREAYYGKSRSQIEEMIQTEMQSWLQEEIITQELMERIRPAKIARFFESNLANRMIAAKKRQELFREQPFVIGLPANRLQEQFPETETILIQGVVDVFFYEEDGIVLADYKTDRVNAPDELVTRYAAQLDYYQQALEQLTGKKVKEKIIYSFAFDQEIRL